MAATQYSPGQLAGWLAKMQAHFGSTPSGPEFKGRCPAHTDAIPSFTFGINTGAPKFHCHTGCSGTKVAAALNQLGLWGEVAVYPYQDPAGTVLYEAVRWEPKMFRQRHPGPKGTPVWGRGSAPHVLYRLPELLANSNSSGPVYIVEGEKDADRLWAIGLTATTNVGGAGKWRPEYALALAGRDVVVLPDNDPPGAAHAAQVAAALVGAVASVKVLPLPGLPPKGDVSDWLNAGGTAAQLQQLATSASLWKGVQLQFSGKPSASVAPAGPAGPAAAPATASATTSIQSPGSSGKPPIKGGKATAIRTALGTLGHTFRFNLVKQQLEIKTGSGGYHQLHDGEQARIVTTLYDAGLEKKDLIIDVMTAEGWAHRYDPLADWLNSLQWDGKDWIAELAACAVDAHDPIEYPDGTVRTVTEAWLRIFFPAAAGRTLFPGEVQVPMLVLVGPQELGKSELVAWLGHAAPEGYYVESSIDPTRIEHARAAAGNWLWEVAELGATIRHSDVEGLKGFLTRMFHTFRVPYARNAVTLPTRASYIGTLNEEQTGFLADATGDRRFLTVEWEQLDWSYKTRVNVQQLWAQACELARQQHAAGTLGRLTDEERAKRAGVNAAHHVEDPVLEAITRHYVLVKQPEVKDSGGYDWGSFVATYDIVRRVQGEVKVSNTRALQMDIARAMTKLGIRKVKNNTTAVGVNGYIGLRIKPGHELAELTFGE